jgi:hypothetical protein
MGHLPKGSPQTANNASAKERRGILQYTSFIVILTFMAILGAGIYSRFFLKTATPFAYSATPLKGGRVLSFQGRLTDTLGNPITASTNVVFKLWDNSSGGSNLFTTSACSVTPDTDGIFNVLIGTAACPDSNGSNPDNPQIPNSVFTQNANVYLGTTVASDSEMIPRQQIANVGYAINA